MVLSEITEYFFGYIQIVHNIYFSRDNILNILLSACKIFLENQKRESDSLGKDA